MDKLLQSYEIISKDCNFAVFLQPTMAESNKPHTPKQPQQGQTKVRRQRLRLPFDNRKKDIGEWSYDNRRGLLVTIIVYLVLAIAFIGSKVTVTSEHADQMMVIDLKTLAELQKEKERLEQEVKQRTQPEDDLSDVRNRISNDHAEESDMDTRLRDDRSTDMEKLTADAKRAQERMRANRERYEQGLADEEAMRRKTDDKSEQKQPTSTKAKGRVTVSYSFVNPVRTATYLDIPAYRCENGGEVIVNVTLNRNGDVVAATIDKTRSATDECMWETALEATRKSRFNIDAAAPERQTGTISYIFIPQ